jgi:predicted NBD/HSP70 family sugar kinase
MGKTFLNNIDGKNAALKQKILGLCINDGDFSLADLSKELGTSIPTTTKLVEELLEDGLLEDRGKQGTNGGRRPSIFGLNPSAGYFVGVDIRRKFISYAVIDFKGTTVAYHELLPFSVQNSEESFAELCIYIKKSLAENNIDEEKVLAYGFNLTGRVNNETGYCFSYFIGEDKPIASVLEKELDRPVFIENDSRAMTYGEYIGGMGKGEKNMLFINVAWGLGMGMIMDGTLSYGKSGFSGEIGHFPLLENNTVCHCGKTGCLETGASGSAVFRIFMDKLKEGRASSLTDKYTNGEDIHIGEIIEAANDEDVLAIEVIEEIGTVLGRAIAGLINVFNPELIVIGGSVAAAKDYLLLPIKSAIQKHSLNIINSDTKIKLSKLGKKAGPIGSCMLSRSKLLGLL